MGAFSEMAIIIDELFENELEKLKKIMNESIEDFRKNGTMNEDVTFTIEMATCEGKVQAFAEVGEKLLGDSSMNAKYEQAVKEYGDAAVKILFPEKMNGHSE